MKRIKKRIKYAIPDKYSHIDFKPPKGAQKAAERALKKRADKPKSQRGMTSVGLARARDLLNGRKLSPATVKRMLAYFTRHQGDKKGATWGDYGKGRQAWDGWGGDAGFTWSRKIVSQMNKADQTTLRAYGEAIQLDSSSQYDIPEGLTVGRPFKTLALGQVSSRMSGEAIGNEIDRGLLEELLRVYQERQEVDPVIIDWQHATSPFNGGAPAPPSSGSALGLIVDLDLREDGLYAVPAYNERGLEVVEQAGGILWSSPEYLQGEIFSRDGGSKVGDAQLLAITLTPRPAQAHSKIDRVTLNEGGFMDYDMDSMNEEELRAALVSKDEMVKELEDKIAEMMADSEAQMTSEETAEADTPAVVEQAEEVKEEEEEKEEVTVKMSETLDATPALLSEINKLREEVASLKSDKETVQRREAVGQLLREGRITPSEEDAASQAWDQRNTSPVFWALFSSRSIGSSVPLEEIGHGASGEELSKKSLDQKVRALSEEKSITYSQALTQFREQNPDSYRAVYGG